MSRGKKRVTVNASLCRGRLYESADGEWYGSSHWIARKYICKLSNTAPVIERHKKDLTMLGIPSPCEYHRALIVNEIQLHGRHPVVVESCIITWIDSNYAKAWGGVGVVYASGPSDPILIGGPDIYSAEVAIMPCRLDQTRIKEYVELLGNYWGK
jgi:hypothetical protein